jgi:hypothetical protein
MEFEMRLKPLLLFQILVPCLFLAYPSRQEETTPPPPDPTTPEESFDAYFPGEIGGAGFVLSGVLFTDNGRRALAVVDGPDGTARTLRAGEAVAGLEILEISEKGMMMSLGGRAVFVPLGGAIPRNDVNRGQR